MRVMVIVKATKEAEAADNPFDVEGAAEMFEAAAHRYTIMALNRRDGKVIWERVAREEAPHEGC